MTEITEARLEEVLLAPDEEVVACFKKEFQGETKDIVHAVYEAYRELLRLEDRVKTAGRLDERSAWVQMFLFNAFNSLVLSYHLFVSGFSVPSGNMMRHYGESISMALLCSLSGTGEFLRFRQNPERYPIHKAMTLVGRRNNLRRLGLNSSQWASFKEITKFFDQYSHPSAVAVANLLKFGSKQLFVGAQFDPVKLEAYRKEISIRRSACDQLSDCITLASRQLLGEDL